MRYQRFSIKKIAFAALESIKTEVDMLENRGFIEKKIHYSECATSAVYIVNKNNKIHICEDFSTGRNDYLIQHAYSLPSPADILAELNGVIFSKLYLTEVYFHIEVEEE